MQTRDHRPSGRSRRARAVLFSLVLTGLPWVRPSLAENQALPLHRRIDDALAHGVGTTLPDRCSDEAFIRRASLDFRGFAPAADEVRAFSADTAGDKRARLLDSFLADPQHSRHLATVLDVLLMERRSEKNVKLAEWRAWLREQVAARTPWDRLVRTLLTADGAEGTPRGAARWLLDRDAEPNALTRDVSRLFLGMDFSCAQCHDHPRITDYRQRDYQGLLAFFSRTYLFQPDPMKPALVGERAEGEASYISVFTKIGGQAPPSLPQGEPLAEPAVPPAEAWLVPPDEKDKNKRPVPKHSRRALLADPLVASRAFALNTANRFWATLLGRGVIDPVDLRHSANPPAADTLLDVLADGLVELKYDIPAFRREVALSRAYQACFDAPADAIAIAVDAPTLQAAADATATAESEARRREEEATEAWEPLQLAAQALDAEAAAAAKGVADARPPAEAAAAALAQARAAATAKADLIPTLEKAAAQCTHAAQVVGDAPELAQAATLLKARLASAKTEQDALNKDLAAKEADHAAKAAAWAAAETKAAAVTPRLAEARAAAETASKKVAEARAVLRSATEAARRASRDAARAHALAEWESAVNRRNQARLQRDAANQAALAVAAAVTETQAVGARLPDDTELASVVAQVQSRSATVNAAAEARRSELEAAETVASAAREAAVPRLTEGFALASLTPLTPEQLCWSLLHTTGTLDQLRDQATREWDEKNPAPADPAAAADPARAATRASAITALLEEKVRPHEDQFVRLFGNGAGSPQTDFFATSDQALYFENAGVLRSWTQPGAGTLANRLATLPDPAALAQEAYLAVLNRSPSDEESAEWTRHFANQPSDQKAAALSDALWALLTSAEFRFKH